MQVDFYVMEDGGRMQALRELCLLLEAPYAAKQSVFIFTHSMEESEQLDKLLWTYRDDSFLAHEIQGAESSAPIQISHLAPVNSSKVLVNLSHSIPAFYPQFERIIEMVYHDAAAQQSARERFRQYREQGLTLNTHKMKVKQS